MAGDKGAYGHLYSLEMSSEQFLQRMISARGRINSQKLRDPVKRFDKGDWERYTAAVEAMAEISRALKVMARDLNVPMIALSQLSRGVESRLDKRPGLSDLRESGSLEQDADIVAFLYREDYYERVGGGGGASGGGSGRSDVIEVIVAKQREGPVGTVELEGIPFVFTDGHAIMAFTEFYNQVKDLDKVDWEVMKSRYWNDTAEFPDRKWRRHFVSIFPMQKY